MATHDTRPDLAGRVTADGHVLPVRVYFEDTDFSGVVYHGAFVRFLERGRSDYVRLLGVRHADLAAGDRPLAFAVRHMTLDFERPARIDDIVEIRSRVQRLTRARLVVAQTITGAGAVLVRALVEVVVIDDRGRPRRLPDDVRRRLDAVAGG